jgi:hypothetical protein
MRPAIVLPLLVGTAWLASRAAPAPGSPEEGPAIEVTSARLANVQPTEGSALSLLQISVRLTNPHASLPWRFDPRATRIDLGADGVVHPVLVNADAQTLPIVMIEPRSVVAVDLYAVAPPRVVTRARVDKLVVKTRIATPDDHRDLAAWPRRVGRLATDATQRTGAHATWWADPSYAWTTFDRGPGPITTRPPTSAAIVAASP